MVKFTATSSDETVRLGCESRFRERQFLPEFFSPVNRQSDATSAIERCACVRKKKERKKIWRRRRDQKVCGVVKAWVTSSTDGRRFDSCRWRKRSEERRVGKGCRGGWW